MNPLVQSGFGKALYTRSLALVAAFETKLGRILAWWSLAAGALCLLRVVTAATPVSGVREQLANALPYILVLAAPVASLILALRWFRCADAMPQPDTRLAVVGRWRSISLGQAKALPLYGTAGFMASLLLGILINIPVRTLEYLAAVPAIGGQAPKWASTYHFVMTLDVVLFTSFYCIAFVAGLKRVPLFPRLLLTIWLADIAMQLACAQLLATSGLPLNVVEALSTLLEGNVKKVLISAALWVPYLLLSRRVNLTFRHRLPANRNDQ
jgi:hypothetical protein